MKKPKPAKQPPIYSHFGQSGLALLGEAATPAQIALWKSLGIVK